MTSIETASEKRSLYDRLGGVYSIATVVDDFIDRIMVDPKLNVNPRVDEAITRCPRLGSSILSPRCCAGWQEGRSATRDVIWRHRIGTSRYRDRVESLHGRPPGDPR